MAGRSYIRLVLYRILPFPIYLWFLCRMFFYSYDTGLLKRNNEYKYYYYLRKFVRRGFVIIDIGANMGYFTRLFSVWTEPAGHVYAVEPVKQMRQQLKYNVRGRRNVTIYPYALGAEEKSVMLGNNSRARLGYLASGQHSVLTEDKSALDTFPAEMRRGSVLFRDLKRIDLIKCDVEGYELVILGDMLQKIIAYKPAILLESGGANRVEAFRLLTAEGYHCYRLEGGVLQPLTEADAAHDDLLYVHPQSNNPIA